MTIHRRPTRNSLLLAASLLAISLTAAATSARAGIDISVQIAPPVLPVYEQPAMPAEGYIWTPGYWAYDQEAGYYWVPGTWVEPPVVGVLWTPPYWGWNNGVYVFNAGYWGPTVGFYGGIDYGFGYGGRGYDGGHWDHGHFAYNRTVNNFGGVHVTNVYNRQVTVINRTQVSYVGGTGGINARPTPAEERAAHEPHRPVTPEQTRHFEAAEHNPAFAAKTNGGHPAVAATARPGEFEGPGVTHERAAAPGPRPVQSNAMQHPPVERPKPGDTAQHPPAEKPNVAQHPAPQPNMAQHPQPGEKPNVAQRPQTAPKPVAHAAPGPRPPTEQKPMERTQAQPSGAPRPGAQPEMHAAPRPAAPAAEHAPAQAPAGEEKKEQQ